MTIASMSDLQTTKLAVEEFKTAYPDLFDRFVHLIHLTRQLQFKFHYMGCLLLNVNPDKYSPKCIDEFVIDLYKKELSGLKNARGFSVLKQLLAENYQEIGYANICKLALGEAPKSLIGASVVK
ncbi:hypothetical protein ABES25_00720 [Bacillus gobiensis]|jgi:hypothetical protein|uniref:hypothetical protein n=1 Tax=Bacillus gobiensis TaxID=1441095 RepID=UPI003D1D5B5B